MKLEHWHSFVASLPVPAPPNNDIPHEGAPLEILEALRDKGYVAQDVRFLQGLELVEGLLRGAVLQTVILGAERLNVLRMLLDDLKAKGTEQTSRISSVSELLEMLGQDTYIVTPDAAVSLDDTLSFLQETETEGRE